MAVEEYVRCRAELLKFIDENNCAPIMVRLAWHDSGNFDHRITEFPDRGGANGSIIHEPEISYGANAGLTKAVNFLKAFKQKYPGGKGEAWSEGKRKRPIKRACVSFHLGR